MSLLRDLIKSDYPELSGVQAVDIRAIAPPREETSEPLREFIAYRSPFFSPGDPGDLKERGATRLCAWYELGDAFHGPFSAKMGGRAGVLLAESDSAEVQVAQVFIRSAPPDSRNPMANLDCLMVVEFESGLPHAFHPEVQEWVVDSGDTMLQQGIADMALQALRIVWMANSLATCKNVRFVQDESGRSRAKRLRKEHRGLVWHRLVIQPARSRVARAATGSAAEELLTRMHLARGHFKTYTEEKPLLGKNVGTWWWSPHVRGDAAIGHVVKDYEVRT
jgi:hypothetical protein